MTRLPRLKGKEVVRALERAGFAVVFPMHSGEIIGPGLLRSILRDIEMSLEEFLEKA